MVVCVLHRTPVPRSMSSRQIASPVGLWAMKVRSPMHTNSAPNLSRVASIWSTTHLVTNPVLDPVSKMPEFKVCAVRLQVVR
jgi:hypothetical protein